MRMIVGALLVGTLAPACAAYDSVRCEDGRVCPTGTSCDDVHKACVTPAQLEACRGKPDGDACALGGASSTGYCDQEVCIAEFCGNGIARDLEQCDGADLAHRACRDLGYYDDKPLTCTSECKYDTTQCTGFCGDAIINGPELCDSNTTTCQALGFANGGTVACAPTCTWATSGCSN